MAVDEQNIMLGSGDLYLGVVANPETATEDQISAALVNVGLISGGATLVYKPKFIDIKAGNRSGTITSIMSDEEVTFKSGILTWDLSNISKLSAAVYSEDDTAGTRRVGIGGLKNVPVNYIRFIHTKPDGKKLTVNVFKGMAQSGFDLAFNSEKETVIDAEFKALSVPNKTNGNLVEVIEEMTAPPAPTVTAMAPATLTVASQPTLITVTGTGFTKDSVVIIDNFASADVDLVTIYDSSTQLKAQITGLSASTVTIKVRNGSSISTASKSLTIS